ncbi:hypothetical protein Bca101_059025 [Brassica carinata]
MSDRVRKQFQEISLGINDSVVDVPIELCEEAIEGNRFSLIVKPINPRRQNLRAMMGAFLRLWGVADVVGARIVENQRIQFLFRDEQSMLSVLSRGPWSFNEWMVSMQRWSPSLSDEDQDFLSFWVQVRGIPIQYLSSRMIARIGYEMGQFLETDFQTDGAQNVDFVRVRLLCNVSTPLRFQRMFRFGGQTVVLRFRYEKLRGFCNTCGLLSHDAAECPLKNDGINDDPPPEDDGDDDEEDGNDDHPPGFQPPNVTPHRPPGAPSEEIREDNQNAGTDSKKRKTTENGSSSTSYQHGADVHQGFLREEYEEVSVKKRMRLEGEQGMRNWYAQKHDGVASTSGVHDDATTDHPTNREEMQLASPLRPNNTEMQSKLDHTNTIRMCTHPGIPRHNGALLLHREHSRP